LLIKRVFPPPAGAFLSCPVHLVCVDVPYVFLTISLEQTSINSPFLPLFVNFSMFGSSEHTDLNPQDISLLGLNYLVLRMRKELEHKDMVWKKN
jgi:hypothetical protein